MKTSALEGATGALPPVDWFLERCNVAVFRTARRMKSGIIRNYPEPSRVKGGGRVGDRVGGGRESLRYCKSIGLLKSANPERLETQFAIGTEGSGCDFRFPNYPLPAGTDPAAGDPLSPILRQQDSSLPLSLPPPPIFNLNGFN